MTDEKTPAEGEYASSPCMLHETDPAYSGLNGPETHDWPQVDGWRKAQRKRLITAREQLPGPVRTERSQAIARRLTPLFEDWSGEIVAVYWPMKGEPDLTAWMREMAAAGVRLALPVVVEKAAPLVFREWRPGVRMERGIWNIPVPVDGPTLHPTVAVAPLVGFDGDSYRLGHGGGYYDRTLASLDPRPYVIGVGYGETKVETIYPQPHDIPMKVIVTEEAVLSPR